MSVNSMDCEEDGSLLLPESSTGTTTNGANSLTPSNNSGTQEIPENYTDDRSNTHVWGVIHALQPEFHDFDLTNDKKRFMFGRSSSCDYSFELPSIQQTPLASHYSKKHFCISCRQNDDTLHAFIKDLGSKNGVFINRKRIPPNNDYPLKSLQKIGISLPTNEVFLFALKNWKNAESSPHPREFDEKYIIDRKIGQGAFGEVFQAWKLGSVANECAVKLVHKLRLTHSTGVQIKDHADVITEANILKQVEHPCIIGIMDVINTPNELYIVLEYARGGDLYARLAGGRRLSEQNAKLFFFQMLSAVAYLHSNGITHRDLKPENVLMMSKKSHCLIKISDFGTSRLVSEASLMTTLAGTSSYLAPELVLLQTSPTKLKPGYTKLVDLWSLGVILYVCLVAYLPFDKNRHDTEQKLSEQILTRNLVFHENQWTNISSMAINLISCLLRVNVNERFSANQAMSHSWIQDRNMMLEAGHLMRGAQLPLTRHDDSGSVQFSPSAADEPSFHSMDTNLQHRCDDKDDDAVPHKSMKLA